MRAAKPKNSPIGNFLTNWVNNIRQEYMLSYLQNFWNYLIPTIFGNNMAILLQVGLDWNNLEPNGHNTPFSICQKKWENILL